MIWNPTHLWHWRRCLPHRKGQPCRLLATGSLNSALVEFADGARVVTSRYALRRLPSAPAGEGQ